MSDIGQDAHVTIFVADYSAPGSDGKINALGLGFSLAGAAGTTSVPQTVSALIDLPPTYAEQSISVSIELRDVTADQVVMVQDPTGQMQALRVGQTMKVEAPSAPPGVLLPDQMPCRIQTGLQFVGGLPLQPQRRYAWVLEINGHHDPKWEARFGTVGQPPPPVFGGAGGPAPSDLPPI